jgi:hypothetical protein
MDAVADPRAPADPARDTYLASWCGQTNCNSAGFTRGVVTNWDGTWTELDLTGRPNRFPNNVAFDPADRTNSTIYLVFNGFNRRFIEGPGAGVKHVYRGKLTRTASGVAASWTDLSVGFPDGPATDVLVVGNKLIVSPTSVSWSPTGGPDPARSSGGGWVRRPAPPGCRCRSPRRSTSTSAATASSTPPPTAAASGSRRCCCSDHL